MLEKNIWTVAINIFILKKENKKICPAYISNINSSFEKQIILLMILNEEKEG